MSSEESDNSSSGSEGEEKHPSKDDNCKGRVSLFFDSDHWQFVTSNGDFVSGKLVKELMGVFDKISENADLFYDRYVQTKKALEDKGGNNYGVIKIFIVLVIVQIFTHSLLIHETSTPQLVYSWMHMLFLTLIEIHYSMYSRPPRRLHLLSVWF